MLVRKISSSVTLDDRNIYVGRNARWGENFWGNPFVVGVHGKRGECIAMFEQWLKTADHILARIDELRGANLFCHCHPLRCHAEVLAEVACMSAAARERWRASPLSCLEVDFEDYTV